MSGTCDTQPYDRAFLATIARALAERCGSGPLRILDLGGGAGNPSVGLAEYGHRGDLVVGVAGGRVEAQVRYQGLGSAPFPVTVVPSVSGIFSADASGAGQAMILNQDGS